jgi:ABC-2 type transport system permease protein
MRKLYGILVLDFKTALSDKVSFFWNLVLPLFSALVLQQTIIKSIQTEEQFLHYFSWFWIFIIISSFIYGIGLKLARFRDSGLLKTYIMISGTKGIFILGTIIVQFLITFASLMIFSLTMCVLYKLSFTMMILVPIILLICSIPFAIATLLLASLPLKHKTLNPLIGILMYPLFLLAINVNYESSTWISLINPFNNLYVTAYNIRLLLSDNYNSINLTPLLFLSFYLFVGLLSVRKINLLSRVKR